MTIDTRIMRGRWRVPVVAFLGTKGGVGTTSIARRFGELITLAESAPNVLLVDVDAHRRGMTVEMKEQAPVACNTVHDYVASRHIDYVEAANLTGTVKRTRVDSGSLLFVPASSGDSDHIFAESASICAERVLEVLHQVVSKAAQTYSCECVVIDCGSVIDPYTAAAAVLADRAFIVGQNEPISFSSLKTYPSRIRDFYPEFRTDKIKIIINTVRGWEQLEQRKLQGQEEIFAAIPFTMDIVDVSEGLAATNEMQLMLFEDHIAKIIEKVFKGDYPELVPPRQSLLPPEWASLMQNLEDLEEATPIRLLRLLTGLLPLGILVAILGAVLFYGASTQRHRAERAAQAEELVISLRSALAEAEASSGPSTPVLRDALLLAQAVDPGDARSLARAVRRAAQAGAEVPPLQRLHSAQENLEMGMILAGVGLGALGFLCLRSRKNYLFAIKALRVGGTGWLMAEMKAKRSARTILNKLLQMAEPEAEFDERSSNMFTYAAGPAHWLSAAFAPRLKSSFTALNSAVTIHRAVSREVVYSAKGKRRRAIPRSARARAKQAIPSVVAAPGSIEDDFAREVRARIKQAQAWNSSLTEDLLRFASIVGLGDRQARKILDKTLLTLGLDNARPFDEELGTNIAKLRQLVSYFLESGDISPQRSAILKNRAREWGIRPEHCEHLVQEAKLAKAEGLSYQGSAAEACESFRETAQETAGDNQRRNSGTERPSPFNEPAPGQTQQQASAASHDADFETWNRRATDRLNCEMVSEDLKLFAGLDAVDCTVFAPRAVNAGVSFLVQVFAHIPEQAQEVIALAELFDPDAQRRGFKSLETRIARGTKLTFDLVLRGLEIEDPVQSLIWNGRSESVQFGVTVPKEHGTGTVIGTVTISQNSIPIGHIKFKLEIVAASTALLLQKPGPVGDDARRYARAFVSYASKDLEKVRPRVQMLSVQGIDYFHDKFDLEPGDRWEKKLYLNIDQCDLFLLFWSRAAKESEWVRKEVNYALDRKSGDDLAPPEICPIPIEAPVPEPWEEAAHIHFDDWRIHYQP